MASRRVSRASYSQIANNDAIVSRLAEQDQVPWYKKPNLRLLYLVMLPTCLGVEMTSGFDASMLSGLQAVPSWLEYYHHPHSLLLGLMTAMYSMGGLIAVPFVPFVVDKFGRRSSIFVGSIFTMIGALLQGASLNAASFTIARFIMGLGNVFAIVAASSMTGELSHPKERAVISSLFNAFVMIGYICAAGVTLATFSMPNNWGWRIPSLLQVIPSFLQVFFLQFLPESPRWLISKGKGDEAYAILVKYHAEGDEKSEFVKAEYSEIERTLAEEMMNAQMSWREIFSTPGMRRRVIIATFLALFMKWSGNTLISYFLSPVLDSVGIHNNRTKNVVNFIKAIWNLGNCIFFALVVPRYPRRKVFLGCTIAVFVVLTAWTAASAEYMRTQNATSSHIVLLLIFLYTPAYHAGYTTLPYTYLIELFPFHARARGITIFQLWAGIASFVSLVVDPIGIDAAGWKYYLVYCVWFAFGIIFVYVMFPETSGRTLEELAFLFENGNGGLEAPRGAEGEPLLLRERSGAADAYDVTEDIPREGSRVRQG